MSMFWEVVELARIHQGELLQETEHIGVSHTDKQPPPTRPSPSLDLRDLLRDVLQLGLRFRER